MLSFLIVLFALIGVQGKAFPSRHKRNYEGSYHYIPYEEGIVQIPAGYSPRNFPNYQDYVDGYVQTNGDDWSAYYQPLLPQPMQHPYLNINEPHKMKAKHTWHFIDQSRVPVTQYTDGMHRAESNGEAPNVVEGLERKIIERHNKYDPIVVEALIRKDYVDRADEEVPVVVDSLTIKQNPIVSKYDRNTFGTEPSASYYMQEPIQDVAFISSNDFELPVVDSLKSKDKPNKDEPVSSNGASELPVAVDSLSNKEKPVKEKPVKEKPVKEKPVKEKPVKEKPVKEKPVKEKPVKEKPVKEKPVYSYKTLHYPVDSDSFDKVQEHERKTSVIEALVREEMPMFPVEEEHESPIVVEALVRKHHTVYENEANTKKEKPVKPFFSLETSHHPIDFGEIEGHEHKTAVTEALIRKGKPTVHVEEEYESPIVVEALVRKHPSVYESETHAKKDEILSEDLLHFKEEPIMTKEDVEKFAIPVEGLRFEQDVKTNESPKRESIASDEIQGFNKPEMDSFDENGDHGSAMEIDKSRFARNFFPVSSDIFSIATNIQEQERRNFKDCVTLKNETGNCMPFQLCSVSSMVTNIDELLRNVCIIDEVFIGVCCPEFPVETVRVDWELLKPDAETLEEEKLSQISKECGRLSSSVTNKDPWPWMASLIGKSSDRIFCGGALITEQYVLTAAHCTIRIPRNQILVRLGQPASEQRPEPAFEVIEIKRHAGYNPRTMQNDIALLKLSRRVQLGNFRRVVCLAKDEGIDGLMGKSASLLHWKETQGEIKDVESLAVISTQECQSGMRTAIADSILCTEPRTDQSMCNADSGAPLIMANDGKFEVIGVLTWNRSDCDERFPAVFTRVSSYHKWIEKLAS